MNATFLSINYFPTNLNFITPFSVMFLLKLITFLPYFTFPGKNIRKIVNLMKNKKKRFEYHRTKC